MTIYEVRFITDENTLSAPTPPKNLWYTDEGLLGKNNAVFTTQKAAQGLLDDLTAEFKDKDISYKPVIVKVEVIS